MNLLPNGSGSSDLIDGAISLWSDGCDEEFGSGFPTVRNGGGGPHPTYFVNILALNVTGNGECGKFLGRDITVYRKTKISASFNQDCGDLNMVLAHEIGHAIGLEDAGGASTCNRHIMATDYAVASQRSLQSGECSAVNQRWTTPLEEAPEGTDPEPIPGTPLLLDLDRNGLISTSGMFDESVSFDIDGDGFQERTYWSSRYGEDAFLWLDLNRNRQVDSGRELFGDATVGPDQSLAKHGFEALAIYDRTAFGGNDNGVIDPADAIWPRLRLWIDRDHDGRSSLGEILSLRSAGIVRFELDYEKRDEVDGNGNMHKLWGWCYQLSGNVVRRVRLVDVFFRYTED